MDDKDNRRPHIYLGAIGKPESFTSPNSGGGPPVDVPPRNRSRHGGALMAQLQDVATRQRTLSEEGHGYDIESIIGIQVDFESFPGIELAVESLADARSGIELTNVRQSGERTYATIFVPDGKLTVIESKLTAYMEERKDRNGKPRDHRALIDAISSFRAATLEALWTDSPDLFPDDTSEPLWWEVWLPVRDDRQAVIRDFCRVAGSLDIVVSDQVLAFPERSILLARGNRGQFEQSGLLLNCVCELKRAKETAAFFDELPPAEHHEWTQELIDRLELPSSADVPVICILDTGVNNEHPLIAPFQSATDQFSVDSDWTGTDDHGHGTGMAGLAIWGDLTDALASDETIRVLHRIESVKILRQSGDNEGKHHGILTTDAVSLAEIQHPGRTRVFAMAVSATDGRDRGRPSAWSAAIDSLAVDLLGNNEFPRLIVLAGGNTGGDRAAFADYPQHNLLQDIHDPGQAWNALTVGAYTSKTTIADEDCASYQALAPEGGLSPHSTTSATWARATPLKPDVVFEGGNLGMDGMSFCCSLPSLGLLTTHHRPLERLFTSFEATSAATALASRFAAEILARYPGLWPETVRALMVHAADWTEAMRQQFAHGSTARQQAQRRVRCVGFGVPDLDKALWSASNSLALIVEDRLQPYQKKASDIGSRDMHLHDLPWPKTALQGLGGVEVELVVTLSYFIEPNPSSRTVAGKYSYASHQLRFDVKRPTESTDEFRKRINREARDAETGLQAGEGGDPKWLLGQYRHKGSLHKDIWRGTAAELAERGQIAVYPALGWWRTRKKLERYDKTARYALVVSIRLPEIDVDVDIYDEIAAQIQVVQSV